MPSRPFWDIPVRRQVANEFAREEISALLGKHGFDHLHVRSHGRHLIIYSEEPDGKRVSRVRFTRVDEEVYELGMADHQGKRESTPFTGSIKELFTQVTSQFGWLLTEF